MCKYCYVCGKTCNLELHHIIFRSKAPFLTNSILNHVYLCSEHHRGTFSPHGKNGHELDVKLKLEFQNKLEMLFDKEYLTEDDIQQTLGISDRAMKSLSKTLTDPRNNHMVEIESGICAEECQKLMSDFFESKRK